MFHWTIPYKIEIMCHKISSCCLLNWRFFYIWKACHTDKLKISVQNEKWRNFAFELNEMRYDTDLLLAVHLSSYIQSNHFAVVVIVVPATVAVLLSLGWSNSSKMCAFCVTFISHSFFKFQIYHDVDVCINIIRFIFSFSHRRIAAVIWFLLHCCQRTKKRITHQTDLFMYINKFIHFNLV